MMVLNESMILAGCIYDADSPDFEKLDEAGYGKEIIDYVNFLPWNSLYGMKRRSEWKITGHDVFGRHNIEDFCDEAERPI